MDAVAAIVILVGTVKLVLLTGLVINIIGSAPTMMLTGAEVVVMPLLSVATAVRA